MDNFPSGQQPSADATDQINIFDYWRVVKKHRRMIAAIVGAVSVLAVITSLLLTKIYKAEALIIPVSSKGGGGLQALSSQFGGLAQLAGMNIPGGTGDIEKFMAFLKSRTLTENVINRFNLLPVLYKKSWDEKKGAWKSDNPNKQPTMEDAVKKMRGIVRISDDKKSKTLRIACEFTDPQQAALMANAYVDELQRFINSNAFTAAKRNRMFIEGQLEENKQDLLEAGKEINEYYTRGRISSSDAQVDVPIARKAGAVEQRDDGTAGTRDDEKVLMANNDAKVEGGEVSGSDAELSALMVKKEDLEKKIAEVRTVENVPQQVYLSYLMLRRELLGKVNALLTTQYEMAKIEESKEDLAFQVIDKAVPPIKRLKPKRAQMCMMAFMAALFIAVFVAFLREYLEKMKAAEAARRRP